MGKKSKDNVQDCEESMIEEQQDASGEPSLSYEEKILLTIPIAQPMAPRKLAKKIFKVMKKGWY